MPQAGIFLAKTQHNDEVVPFPLFLDTMIHTNISILGRDYPIFLADNGNRHIMFQGENINVHGPFLLIPFPFMYQGCHLLFFFFLCENIECTLLRNTHLKNYAE